MEGPGLTEVSQKKVELRLSPLLNQWTEASQSRLQFTVRLCKRHETQQYNSVPLVVSRMELLKDEIYFFQWPARCRGGSDIIAKLLKFP